MSDQSEHAQSPAANELRPPLTKIVATLGPASSEADVIGRLIEAGVAVFRLNFSHGDAASHGRTLRTVRAVAADMQRPIAVLGDLQGPKIRVGSVVDGGVDVPKGATVIVQREPIEAHVPPNGSYRFSCTYEHLVDEVGPGHRLLVNDGAVRMLVLDTTADEVHCSVTVGGLITSAKGINLPDTQLSASALSDRDLENARWAIEHDVDFLALSFVASAADVQRLRTCIEDWQATLGRSGEVMPIVSKIERPAAVACMDEVVAASDAIMVARGDLGVEMDLAEVPVIQRKLVAAAQAYGKPVIVATQMLESMINSPTPTRAEASDVATAIFDEVDAVMLSGETAVGQYPLVTVETMSRIASRTEAHLATLPPLESPPTKLVESQYRTAALAHGVWTVAHDIGAKFIVIWSQRGGGARYLSQNSFRIPILAASTDERTLRQMQLLRGVTPIFMPRPDNLARFTEMMDAWMLASRWAEPGDPCVLVAGGPIGEPGVTNSLAIHYVGDPTGGFRRHG